MLAPVAHSTPGKKNGRGTRVECSSILDVTLIPSSKTGRDTNSMVKDSTRHSWPDVWECRISSYDCAAFEACSHLLRVEDIAFFIDNLLVRIHFIIELIWWTGLAPWEIEFPFPGGLISTFRMSGTKLGYFQPIQGRGVHKGVTNATRWTTCLSSKVNSPDISYL